MFERHISIRTFALFFVRLENILKFCKTSHPYMGQYSQRIMYLRQTYIEILSTLNLKTVIFSHFSGFNSYEI